MTDYKVNIINQKFLKYKNNCTQKFKNIEESNPLELKIFVYKKENIIFSSFQHNLEIQ